MREGGKKQQRRTDKGRQSVTDGTTYQIVLLLHLLHQRFQSEEEGRRVGVLIVLYNKLLPEREREREIKPFTSGQDTLTCGTLFLASSPSICSLGIHPSLLIRSNQ